MFAISASTIWLLSTIAANGQDTALLQAFGKAGESCGHYLQAYEEERKLRPAGAPEGLAFSDRYAAFLDFADGYMTGANSYSQGADRLLGQ